MHNVFPLSALCQVAKDECAHLTPTKGSVTVEHFWVKRHYNGSGTCTAWRDYLSPDLITRNHRAPIQPTPSRVASEATCVQRQWVSCMYATSERLPSFLKSPQLSLAALSRAFLPRRSWRSTPLLRRVSSVSQHRAAPPSTWLRRSGGGSAPQGRVHCLSAAAKRLGAPSSTSVRIPAVPQGVSCSTLATAEACPRSSTRISDMRLHASGVRDTAPSLPICPHTRAA